jgi:RNA polymerase sigma factor (sigma-70 family)
LDIASPYPTLVCIDARMAEGPDKFLPTRQSLLVRLQDWDDQESWRDFFNTYWRLIYNTAVKSGLTDAEAQEVVQETVVAVAKQMQDQKYDSAAGSFKAWLLRLTRWRIADQFRKRRPDAAPAAEHPDETRRTAVIDRIPDPASLDVDAIWDEEWEQTVLEAATERVKRQVNPDQYQIFDLYVIRKWPARKVAKTLNVSLTQVYLAKHRIVRLVKKEVARVRKKLT